MRAGGDGGLEGFLLGGRDGVGGQAAARLQARYRNIQIVGMYEGSPDPDDEAEYSQAHQRERRGIVICGVRRAGTRHLDSTTSQSVKKYARGDRRWRRIRFYCQKSSPCPRLDAEIGVGMLFSTRASALANPAADVHL